MLDTLDELFDTRDEADAEIRALARAKAQSREFHPAQERLWEAQRKLAAEFGKIFGWRLSETSFGPDVLARRGMHSGWPGRGPVLREFCDHADYYRLNRRAAGVVAHLYPGGVERAPEWAAENGLVADVLPDIPSWYSQFTTVVLYRPRRRA